LDILEEEIIQHRQRRIFLHSLVSDEQKSVTHSFEDEFNSLPFTLNPNIETALQTPGRNCTIRPVLNIPYGPPSGTFYFDNMGFIQ
jgi:hypothetical protein